MMRMRVDDDDDWPLGSDVFDYKSTQAADAASANITPGPTTLLSTHVPDPPSIPRVIDC